MYSSHVLNVHTKIIPEKLRFSEIFKRSVFDHFRYRPFSLQYVGFTIEIFFGGLL